MPNHVSPFVLDNARERENQRAWIERSDTLCPNDSFVALLVVLVAVWSAERPDSFADLAEKLSPLCEYFNYDGCKRQ